MENPGAYEVAFYPTVPTTFTYRIFGTINNTPVDLTFSCTPIGEVGATANNSTVQISQGVVRKGIEGGFGCPAPISEAGFPEPYMSNYEITTKLEQLQSEIPSINSSAGSTATTGANEIILLLLPKPKIPRNDAATSTSTTDQ